ncbi:odorant receptor 13a-like [Prorops nasuta]|uniref:odorant receptor 13a-like n=1 Tax=Prorops nasuta TaxID=863751 RepID=UPI0034CDA4F0
MWPFPERKRLLSLLVFDITIISFIILMVLKLIEDHFDLDVMLDVVPTIAFLIMIQATSLNLRCRFQSFSDLWLRVKNDWDEARIDEESKIKNFYAKRSQTITQFVYISAFVAAIIVLTASTFYTEILNVVSPSNETRPRELLYEMKVFLDKQKYFYFYVGLTNLTCITSNFLLAVYFSAFQALFLHVCGMFSISGYRIQHAISKSTLKELGKSDLNEIYYQTVIQYIERYKNALKFVKDLESHFAPIFIMSLSMSITVLAPILYQLSDPKVDTVKPCVQLFFHFGFFLLVSLFGQTLINITSDLTNNAQWERCSVNIQKLLPLIINGTGKQVEFTALKMYSLSLNYFRMVSFF